jgi:hypothetical protein
VTGYRDAKFFQDQPQRAETRKSELKEVETDKGGKKKPVYAVI